MYVDNILMYKSNKLSLLFCVDCTTSFSCLSLLLAPGPVANFSKEEAPGGNYTLLAVSWLTPSLLDRNGVIAKYILDSNATVSYIFLYFARPYISYK